MICTIFLAIMFAQAIMTKVSFTLKMICFIAFFVCQIVATLNYNRLLERVNVLEEKVNYEEESETEDV